MTSATPYMVEGLDLDLHEALAAAIEAAKKAGRILWDAAQRRRAAVAAAYAPTSLPSKSPPEESPSSVHVEGQRTEEEEAEAEAADNKAAAKAFENPFYAEVKTAPNDLVTYYDKLCDAVIMRCLKEYIDRTNNTCPTPGLNGAGEASAHGDGRDAAGGGKRASTVKHNFCFITEELAPTNSLTDDLTWIVDPIDGTLSFVHGLPDCCVSIGLTYKKECILAVVFAPFLSTGITGVMQAAHAKEALGNPSSSSRTTTTTTGTGSTPPLPQVSSAPASTSKRAIPPPPISPTLLSTLPASLPTGMQPHRPIHPPSSLPIAAAARTTVEEAGVVECVGELYTSLKGRGVFLNGVPVKVNAEATQQTAIAVFNCPFSVSLSKAELEQVKAAVSTEQERAKKQQDIRHAKMHQAIDAVGEITRQMCLDKLPGVRAYGSCVTTLSLIAAGRIDLYVEPAGKVWDVVCGSLLVKEAGGCVRNMVGQPFDMARDTTIAAGATEDLVQYATKLCVQHRLGQLYLE